VKIETPDGTDYAVLNAETFEFADGDLQSNTAAGLVQIRADGVTLTLSQPGSISWGEHRLESDKPMSKHFPKP
jgi:hypothetical protein